MAHRTNGSPENVRFGMTLAISSASAFTSRMGFPKPSQIQSSRTWQAWDSLSVHFRANLGATPTQELGLIERQSIGSALLTRGQPIDHVAELLLPKSHDFQQWYIASIA